VAGKKYLIVNADDFGQRPGVNRGIIEAHEHGILTSASLMVRWPAAVEAGAYCQERPRFSIGLHVDLGEWAYRDGTWMPLYEVVSMNDVEAVKEEVARQLATFRRLVGKDPTHIDSHQHVHLREPARSVLEEIAHRVGAPLRHCGSKVRYCGDFYGQTAEGAPLSNFISVDHLVRILAALPPGITELACHPGEDNDLDTMYQNERVEEVRVLCDPAVRAAITEMGIELCSFYDIRPEIGIHTYQASMK
jgi:chitin disaccharide deacetylase